MNGLAVAVLLLALAGDLPPLEATDVVWTQSAADGADVPAFRPEQTGFTGGEVLLDCGFAPNGRLDDCHVARENPPGYGLAAYALTLAPYYGSAPLTKSGAPIAGRRVIAPFRFGEQARAAPQ